MNAKSMVFWSYCVVSDMLKISELREDMCQQMSIALRSFTNGRPQSCHVRLSLTRLFCLQ